MPIPNQYAPCQICVHRHTDISRKCSKKNCEKPAILKDKLRFATETSYFPAQNWCFGKSGQGRAATQDPPGATGGGFTEPDGEGGRIYRAARFSIARPMLMRLSAMTPRP